jgi:hypothetical protein
LARTRKAYAAGEPITLIKNHPRSHEKSSTFYICIKRKHHHIHDLLTRLFEFDISTPRPIHWASMGKAFFDISPPFTSRAISALQQFSHFYRSIILISITTIVASLELGRL